MNRQQTMATLQDIFNDLLVEEVTLTESLSARDVAEWDSLTHISLVVAVEKHIDIKFRLGEVESTANIGEFIDLILKRCGS